jgi:hypothetical protein
VATGAYAPRLTVAAVARRASIGGAVSCILYPIRLSPYEQEHEATEALFAESKTRIVAIDDLLHENSEEQKRLN